TDMEDHWAQASVELLASKQVIMGDSRTSFEPEREVSRAEFAAMLVRAPGLDANHGGATFSDVPADAWYAAEIDVAAKHGIITGTSAGLFQPNDGVTRQEIAVMAARALEFAAGQSVRADHAGSRLKRFADEANIAAWAKEGVQLAVGSGLMQGRADGS